MSTKTIFVIFKFTLLIFLILVFSSNSFAQVKSPTMSTKSIFFLSKFTLLIFLILVFSSNSFARGVPPEYTVRVVYFLPSDHKSQPDIDAKLDRLIKNTQRFFAEQMTAHGFDQKTFEFEADDAGNVVVHCVNGQFNEAYYNSGTWEKVWKEIKLRCDLSHNIWLTALETSTEAIYDTEVMDGDLCGLGLGSSLQGRVLIPASGKCFNVSVAGHELGHAFGLGHDNRTSGRWIPSVYSPDRMITSFCSAEWLDVHRYIKPDQTLSNIPHPPLEMLVPDLSDPLSATASQEMTHPCGVGALDVQRNFAVNQTDQGDARPTFEMLEVSRFVDESNKIAKPNKIRLRFEVTGADGLHQVQLHTPEWDPGVAGGFIACQRLNGTSAIVEFVTTELSPKSKSVSLSVIDVHGNFFWSDPYPIDVSSVLPEAKAVTIPDTTLAAAVRQNIGDITTHSLLDLRELDAKDYTPITDLTGLEYAYNLKWLEVISGGITDLQPLANLKGLTDLDLHKNQISDISVVGNLTNLSGLIMWDNQISDITAVGNLTNLRELNLGGNKISDITAIGNLTNLRELYFDGNEISDISVVRNLTNLSKLVMWDNEISDITTVGNLAHLEVLSLGGNKVSDITAVGNLTNLRELYFDGNEISDISAGRKLDKLSS